MRGKKLVAWNFLSHDCLLLLFLLVMPHSHHRANVNSASVKRLKCVNLILISDRVAANIISMYKSFIFNVCDAVFFSLRFSSSRVCVAVPIFLLLSFTLAKHRNKPCTYEHAH